MMATASIEPAEYECPVCNDYFKKPKLLLCGHVLCRDCLFSWLQSNKEALCPLCRCSMINAQVKAVNSLGDMVDMLPDDVAMEALVESAKIINTNHICFLHADKAAVAICLQCRESYCQNCSEPHKKSSATRHHHVEDLSTLTAEKLAANRHAVCTTHGDKTAELFCSTHHIPICQMCALLEHHDCCDLLDLKKRADVARGQLEQLLANLTSAELSLKESTSKLDQIESNLEKNTQTVTHSLEETQNYLQRLAKICNQRIAEVYKSNSENKNKIRIAKEDLLKRHGKAVSHKLVVKRVQQTISGSELFDITTKLKACIGDLVLDATLPADLESFTVPGFTFDVKVLANLEDDLSHFGSLPTSVTKQNLRSQPQMTGNGGSGNAVLINTMPYQMPSPATITTPQVQITPQLSQFMEVEDDKPKATILGTRFGKGITKYDRDVLLSLSAKPQSRRRPANLPDIPKIILIKPITETYENLKPFPVYTPGFFVQKMKFPASIQVKIPREHHQYLLGKNGKKLQELELATQTKIQIPQPDENSDFVKISGTKDSIDKAQYEIECISEEQAKLAFERLPVPKAFHPFVCGPFNQTIKQLIDETGTRINVPPASVDKDEIVVSGEKEGVAKCKQVIMQIFEEKRKKCQTVSVEVSKSQHCYVIGPCGSNIQDILAATGVAIDVPPLDTPSETITLHGEQDKLGPALTMVYSKANSVIFSEVIAPSWLHQFVIGKHGANIRKLMEDYPKVYIEFTDGQDKITLEGPPEEVQLAVRGLKDFIDDLKKRMDYAEIEVDHKFHKHIIGKSGSNITRIKNDMGVSIRIPLDGENSNIIRIEGDSAGVIKAKEELLELAQRMFSSQAVLGANNLVSTFNLLSLTKRTCGALQLSKLVLQLMKEKLLKKPSHQSSEI